MLRFLLVAGALALSGAAEAQQAPADARITAAERVRIVHAAADAFAAYHYDVEQGAAIAAALRQQVRAGAYDRVTTALALTRAVQQTLNTFHDRHLNFGYSGRVTPLGFEPPPTPDDIAAEAEQQRRNGFDIRSVDRLDGNIGLWRIDGFPNPQVAGDALSASMRLLDGADALIIDLRQNTGGDADTVNLIASWFLGPDPVHISDEIRRDQITQRWSVEWLPVRRFEGPVYILTSSDTYSGGEALAYTLQGMHRARIVGEVTRGGAHPSRWYTIDPHFAVHIPWSRGVFVSTASDWEGVGVHPDIAASAADGLRVARRQALTDLAATATADRRQELQQALQALDAER